MNVFAVLFIIHTSYPFIIFCSENLAFKSLLQITQKFIIFIANQTYVRINGQQHLLYALLQFSVC